MRRIIVVLAMLVAGAVASRVSAADLEAMSRSQKRIYCVAYGLIDVRMRYLGGQVDKARFDWERKQLTWKIMNRGDNFNYAPDFRKLDAGDRRDRRGGAVARGAVGAGGGVPAVSSFVSGRD